MPGSLNLNGYTISLFNVDNSKYPNQQTWTYKITQSPRPLDNIKNWSLLLSPEHKILSDNSKTNIGISAVEYNDYSCFSRSDNVIKWIINDKTFEIGTFSFTLEGCWKESVIQVAIQTGNNCIIGTINGPGGSCYCLNTTTYTTTTTTTTTSTTSTSTTTTVPTRGIRIF